MANNNEEERKRVGDAITLLMGEAGVRSADLALRLSELLDEDARSLENNIGRWRRGVMLPPRPIVYAIEDALGVPELAVERLASGRGQLDLEDLLHVISQSTQINEHWRAALLALAVEAIADTQRKRDGRLTEARSISAPRKKTRSRSKR